MALTPANILNSFTGAGIFTVDKERPINRLSGRGTKRKERSFDRAPLVDLPVLVNHEHIKDSLGRHAELNLRRRGHTFTGLRVNDEFFDAYLQEKERTVRPTIRRSSQGVTAGNPLTADTTLAEYEGAEKKEEEETVKPRRWWRGRPNVRRRQRHWPRESDSREAVVRQQGTSARNAATVEGLNAAGMMEDSRQEQKGPAGVRDPHRLGWLLRVGRVL